MEDDFTTKLTLRNRWDRIVSALSNPFDVSPLSPEGKIGILDLWWALQMFFVGFTKDNPEQAGKCFYYTSALLSVSLLLLLIGWLF